MRNAANSSNFLTQEQKRWLLKEVERLNSWNSNLKRLPEMEEPRKPKAVIEYERKMAAYRARRNKAQKAHEEKARALVTAAKDAIHFGTQAEALAAVEKLRARARQ